MRIVFLGLGKLGLPIAACLAQHHVVIGVDPIPDRLISGRTLPEAGDGMTPWPEFLDQAHLTQADSLEGAFDFDPDFVFVCVQTPHGPEYEGVTPMPEERRDFDYTTLASCVDSLAEFIPAGVPVVIVSTVLPGTTRKLLPLLPDNPVIYSPSFCAMGTVVADWFRPEGVLIGRNSRMAPLADPYLALLEVAGLVTDNGYFPMSIESAELAKVSYNTFISMKLATINVIGEICDNIKGADIGDVSSWLQAATRRVSSGAYMHAGLGDGGACHPRDNIAMSWLAQRHALHADPFSFAMEARQEHAIWLADLCKRAALYGVGADGVYFPVVIYGENYKAGSPLTDGSHARLIDHYLRDAGVETVAINTGSMTAPQLQAILAAAPRHVALVASPEPWMCDVVWDNAVAVIDSWRIVPRQNVPDDALLWSIGSAGRGAG